MKKLERIREIAKGNGGECLSDAYVHSREKLEFRCAKGHIFYRDAARIVRPTNKEWCTLCASNAPRSLDELATIAKSRGGRLLSRQYKGVEGLYDFECSLGHQFTNRFKKIEGGQWCPTCAKAGKSEEVTRTVFEQLLGRRFPKKRPRWLRNSRGRQMELDGYCEELGVAFEYQGRQHYEELTHFEGNLAQRIEDDQRKVELCRENDVTLMAISYEVPLTEMASHVEDRLVKLGLTEHLVRDANAVDLALAYIREDRLEELRSLLAPKQITVLFNQVARHERELRHALRSLRIHVAGQG